VSDVWDLVIVGAGPAGSAAALGALHAAPGLRVLLLDRTDFPRDKPCGDGIAPHALDVLAAVGVHGLLDDKVPVHRLELVSGTDRVSRLMARNAYVVPRAELDARLLERAVAAGACFRRRRVSGVRLGQTHAVVDCAEPGADATGAPIRARTVVGADGAHSVVRRAVAPGRRPRSALALRGYAPVQDATRGRQLIVFGPRRQPAYAWSFDRGDGLANVGYGELLRRRGPAPSRALLLGQLAELLPGASTGGAGWRGHHLPLSSWPWRHPDGRVLLVGDAAHLVNPVTGEGIYYAVATGVLAGRAVVRALDTDPRPSGGAGAGGEHRRAVRLLLGRHLLHTRFTAGLVQVPALVQAAVRASAAQQHVFDDLVELGLGGGRITAGVVREMSRHVVPPTR